MKLYGIPEDQAVTIKTLTIKTLTAKTRGTLGELTAAKRLTRDGFTVRKQREGDKLGDLIAKSGDDMKTIEVKTAFRGSRGTFQFCLYRELENRVCTDHTHADFVLLLAVEDDFSVIGFLIPSSELTQKKLEFRDPLLCKWRKYLVWQ